MIRYPALEAVVAELGEAEVSRRSGVPLAELRQLVAGGWAAAPLTRIYLARAVGADPDELFRAVSAPLDADLEPALARAPSGRHVTDQATLRALARRP